MTGGFLMAVIATVIVIVIAAPEYAAPAAGGSTPAGSASPAPSSSMAAADVAAPTSRAPDKLRGYRWPVRGGTLADFYDWDRQGLFVIDGKRVHAGLVITWFDGAKVKAAHKGIVVAAGRDWLRHVGFEAPMDGFYQQSKRRKRDIPVGIVIDDGNGYRSVYTNLKNLRVKAGDQVRSGTDIGEMTVSERRYHMRYQLVRMDGPWMKVSKAGRKSGYPDYAREHVDPLAVLRIDANKMPLIKKQPPTDPPRLSEY